MDRREFLRFAALGTAMAAVPATAKPVDKVDLLIKGGTVYNGVDSTPMIADIAVKGDRIVYIGEAGSRITRKLKAVKTIEAAGYVVCPGFIDPHNHMESDLLKDKAAESYLRMGVTSMITGMCGGSQYPVSKFFGTMEKQGIGVNVGSFTGHNTIRRNVMGEVDRFATDDEIAKMQQMICEEIDNGSMGLSTGLFYVPGCFSEEKEVVAIAQAMAPKGGIYTTHVRYENKDGIGLYNSIVEALEVGRKSGVPVNISHIKCLGRSVWHQSDKVIDVIEQYQKKGIRVTADQYPYLASGLAMSSALTPKWCRDGGTKGMRERFKDPEQLAKIKEELPSLIYERGGAETIFIAKRSKFAGKTLLQAANELGMTPEDTIIELLSKESPYLNTFIANEEDLTNYMKQPWVMTCSDGTYGTHPRACGSFAEKLEKYVVQKKVISLPEFIRKTTSLTAETYGLKDRGVIRIGAYADIVVFKPEEVRAKATYQEATLLAEGFKDVIVNGVVAVEDDVYTGTLSGKILRKQA